MTEIIKMKNDKLMPTEDYKNIIEKTEGMLNDISSITSDKHVRSVPIAALASLGGSAASWHPYRRHFGR